jgi:hypothetical protein
VLRSHSPTLRLIEASVESSQGAMRYFERYNRRPVVSITEVGACCRVPAQMLIAQAEPSPAAANGLTCGVERERARNKRLRFFVDLVESSPRFEVSSLFAFECALGACLPEWLFKAFVRVVSGCALSRGERGGADLLSTGEPPHRTSPQTSSISASNWPRRRTRPSGTFSPAYWRRKKPNLTS